MAKKKISRDSIKKEYENHLLEEGKASQTVRMFCKSLGIEDDVFYQHFGSLRSVESAIWQDFFKNTLKVILNDPDFEQMNGREKHLSFLYTLLEVVKPHRSYLLFRLEGKKPHELPHQVRKTFSVIAESDIQWTQPLKFLPKSALDKSHAIYRKTLWTHAISLLMFWIHDESSESIDTDLFIEKSTRTLFDVGELPALDSIIDFGKFFFQKVGFSKSPF